MDDTSSTLMEINRHVLPNGLRVVHHYMPDTAMVTLNVMYDTGARDEDPAMTGIAHLFEHLMFGGSQNVPDFDAVLTAAGGISNAWTSNDFTDFYEIAPAHNAETLFYLESDRMLAPALTQESLSIQQSVVIEEFKQQCLNRPYGNMDHHLRRMVYGNHPYSWPVIGKDFESIAAVTTEDVRRWWATNYSPDNAVLSITGNIPWEEALRLTVKWFGDIPARSRAPRALPPIPDLEAAVERTVHGNVPATMVTVAYLMDPNGTQQYMAADAITDILSAGKASRFYNRINMNPESIVVDADASILGSEHRGLLMLKGRLANEDIDPQSAARVLVDTARTIITEGITERELQRLKNRQRSIFVMSNMACLSAALNIAEAEMHGEKPGERLDKYNLLTAGQITDTARHIFDNTHPAILYYRPQ